MNDFDTKWRLCAARARQASCPDPNVPLGFAARVVARGFAAPVPSWEALWERWAFRVLLGTAALLLICAALEAPYCRERSPLSLEVGNTMAQVIWSL